MADVFQWWQQDLTISSDGDLLIASGALKSGQYSAVAATVEGEQRVLRRLLTTAGLYIWHLDYGAGLPNYVGSVAQEQTIEAVILSQMLLENAVAQSPLPVVEITPIVNGITANIAYVDNLVGQQVTIGFNLDA